MSHQESPSYEELKAQCLKENRYFIDADFPATDRSIYLSQPTPSYITWKRPPEFCNNPKFIVNDLTRFDLDQGSLGNCWFIAAAAALAKTPELMKSVVLPNQSFTENYAGIFHFKFWRYGAWQEVVIDDRLPVRSDNQLEFCHNKEETNEFWSALLEKAYAKLNGSYEALLGGNMQDAMVDLTGGVSESLELSKSNDDLFSYMQKIESANSLMGCVISILGKSGSESYDKGLLSGHAYSISGVTTITTTGSKEVRLIRLLNPWGKAEWSGAWADSSDKWQDVSEETKKELQLKVSEEGEFWMSFDEWREVFTQLHMCHLVSRNFRDPNRDWQEQSAHGRWVKGVNAGGCGMSPNEKFYWDNPQYCLVRGDSNEDKLPIIVSLMQKEKRELTESGCVVSSNIVIGFRLFRIMIDQIVCLDNTMYPQKTVTLEKGRYFNIREVSYHYDHIGPGIYCVIPTTYKPNEEAEFFLRVLTHDETKLITPPKPGEMQFMSRTPFGPARNTVFYGNMNRSDEPLLTAVKFERSSLSWSAPPDHDTPDDTHSSQQTMTPAELELLEVYNTFVSKERPLPVDANILRKILLSLNEIGQLGGYKLNFSEADAKHLFRMMDFWMDREGLTYEQVKELVKIIKSWIREFAMNDKDFTEFIPFRELWKILSSLGFQLDTRTKEIITTSYYSQLQGLLISQFINCAARIYAIQAYWTTKTPEESYDISFQELLQVVLLT